MSARPACEAPAACDYQDMSRGVMRRAIQKRCTAASSWTLHREPCTWQPAVRTGSTCGILPLGASWTAQDPPWTSGMNLQVVMPFRWCAACLPLSAVPEPALATSVPDPVMILSNLAVVFTWRGR